MYILLENNTVKEIIPEVHPSLPGVPLEQRYPAQFIEKLIQVNDGQDVPLGYEYDPETGLFSEPSPPAEIEAEYEEIPPQTKPSSLEQLRADLDYIAVMTGVTL